MNFYEERSIIIIHGGRNDDIEHRALNDTYILDVSNMQWIEVILNNYNNDFFLFRRFGHRGIVYTDKLIIFGGMNDSNYLGSSLMIINLNLEKKVEDKITIMNRILTDIKNTNPKKYNFEKGVSVEEMYERMKQFQRKISQVKGFKLPDIRNSIISQENDND